MKKSILFVLITLLLSLSGTHLLQRGQEHYFPSPDDFEDIKDLPSGSFLGGAALSFDEVLADLFWIKTIGYFGNHNNTDKIFPWLFHLLDVTTSLDPFFEDPYEFGGVVLGYQLDDHANSFKILEKGMQNVPKHHKRYWYLPFFTAFNYMYYKGDYQTAAHYLEIAATFPQSPPYLPLLVARLYANTDDPGVAIPFLQNMIERAATPEMEEKLQLRIKEVSVKQHLHLLNIALKEYKKIKGDVNPQIEDLVTFGFIKSIPEEPFGGSYYISMDGDSVRTSSDVDSMELHLDVPDTGPFMLQGTN